MCPPPPCICVNYAISIDHYPYTVLYQRTSSRALLALSALSTKGAGLHRQHRLHPKSVKSLLNTLRALSTLPLIKDLNWFDSMPEAEPPFVNSLGPRTVCAYG